MNDAPMSEGGRTSLWDRLVKDRLVLVVVVFLLALIPRSLNLDVFVGPDEFSWVDRSANFARALSQGDFAATYQTGHPGVTVMWAETLADLALRAVGAAPLLVPPGTENDIHVLARHRLVVACVNALVVALAALLARSVFGGCAGWLTGFLLAFCPFLLTESRALRTEGLVTGFATLALLMLLGYGRRPRKLYACLAGVLTALALLSKVSAVALFPVTAIVFLFGMFRRPASPRRSWWADLILPVGLWTLSLAVTLVVLWPALWGGPLDVAAKMWDYIGFRATEGGGGGKSFFMGQPEMAESLSPLFYPVVLAYRSSPLLWLGLLGLLVLAFGRREESRAWRWTLAGISLYLLTYLVLISRTDLKYDRYGIPMLPPLAVAAAAGFVAVWHRVTAQWKRLAGWGWLPALLLLAGQAVLAIPHHPYYYTYWNPVLGGARQAVNVLPIGLGGEGIDQVAAYLNALPDAESITLASANGQKIKPVFKGRTISMTNLDGKWFLADYTFLYISQLQRGKHFPVIVRYLQRRPPVSTVTLGGLDYGDLYPGPAAQFWGGDTKLEGQATLHAYDLSATQLRGGETLTVTVYYRREGQGPGEAFFVDLVDDEGYVWSEGLVEPLPGFEEAAVTRSEIVEGRAELRLPLGILPGNDRLVMGFRERAGAKVIGVFELPEDNDRVAVDWGSVAEASPGTSACLTVGEELALVDLDLPSLDAAGGRQWVTLTWQALRPVGRDYVLLVRVLDSRDGELSYRLGPPARSLLPTGRWREGQVVMDPWLVDVPSECTPGACHLELAVFDAATQAEVLRSPLTVEMCR